jgi:hypothetical protein
MKLAAAAPGKIFTVDKDAVSIEEETNGRFQDKQGERHFQQSGT